MSNSESKDKSKTESDLKTQKKLKLAADLYELALEIKIHQLEKKYPGKSREELRREVQKMMDNAG